jgi:hypothetical protein
LVSAEAGVAGRVTRSFDGTLNKVLGTVCRLETGTVFTLSNVDLGIGVLTTVDGTLDNDVGLGIVVSTMGREFDVDVRGCLFG